MVARNARERIWQLGAITDAERQEAIDGSPLAGKYEAVRDRESAYEMLKRRAAPAAREAERAEAVDGPAPVRARCYSAHAPHRSCGQDGLGAAMTEALARELKGTTGHRLVRGILGNLFKGR